MTVEEKLKELEMQAKEINTQLQNGEQQRQQLTGELLKKIGGIEALQALLEVKKEDEYSQ